MDPNTKAALPRCRATDTCWRRKAQALISCVAVWIHLPIAISANRSRNYNYIHNMLEISSIGCIQPIKDLAYEGHKF